MSNLLTMNIVNTATQYELNLSCFELIMENMFAFYFKKFL